MNLPPELLEKLKKLLSLQERAGTQAEAENAAAKIQEMCLKYNLDMQSVKDSANKEDNLIEKEEFDLNTTQGKSDGTWVVSLWKVLSVHNMCTIIKINNGTREGKVSVIGLPINIAFVQYAFDQLYSKIKTIEKIAWDEYQKALPSEKRGTFRRGFYVGAVAGINHKLEQQKEALKKQFEETMAEENLTSLMVTNEKAIEEFIQETFSNLHKTKARKMISQDGNQLGYEKGKQLDINKGIGNKSTNQLRLN